MTARELVEKMLEWEELKASLDTVEKEIQAAVLVLAKTQNIGNVRASYSGGRKTYDYHAGSDGVPAEIVQKNTEIIPATTRTDWKGVCEDAEVKIIPFTKSDPSVTVKLMPK